MIVKDNNSNPSNKDYFYKSKKYRPNPAAQQALSEIAIVNQMQNLIAYANNFVVRSGRFSLQYETDDELGREELWRKKEHQRQLQQWHKQEERWMA